MSQPNRSALGQLAGGIAHDMNNVLHAVQGALGTILRRVEDAEKVREMARLASDAAERGASVVRRLLAFSGKPGAAHEDADVASLLEGLHAILRHTLGGTIEVVTEVAAALPAIRADRRQLETVLVNLAINARDAMPGGGRLTLRASASPPPEPEAAPARPLVRIAVADTGQGMSADVLRRASEAFFTTKPAGHGTGLGLAMAREFAEGAGGALRIASEPGRGTEVTLWLPAAGSGASDPASSATGASAT
ncbi:ATP-binding protein [Alsobacter sp. KACC 23698]|uniref:histidine kinase n=1 Tax=Alsobacter sp. KACC 23698 TaxID=3149229 RepID=A0AAU7JGF8_9HYPH